MPEPRPNILWICTDQQRYDTIHALGNDHIRTPNIDGLAAAGVAFTHAYCQSPICTPSRASFLTGMYPSSVHGCMNPSLLSTYTGDSHPRYKEDPTCFMMMIRNLHGSPGETKSE